MNKLLKGAIAGAAGVALLLGGAGTFALWNSTATVAGGTIVAGNLKVTSAGVGTWESTAGPISNINAYRIVPGDVLTYTKTITTTATGDNLKATLTLADASIVASNDTKAADVALRDFLKDHAVVAATGTGMTPISTGLYSISTGTATPVVVTVTIAFPASEVLGAENDAKLGSVKLAGVAVNLNQVIPVG